MNVIARWVVHTQEKEGIIRVLVGPVLQLFLLGSKMNASLDSLAKRTIIWSLMIFALLTLLFLIPVDSSEYPEYEGFTENEIFAYRLFWGIWFAFLLCLTILRYAYASKDYIKSSLRFEDRKQLHNFAIYILESKDKSFFHRVLCKPFYNALKKGASMEERDSARLLILMAGSLLVSVAFFINNFWEFNAVLTTFAIILVVAQSVFIALQYGYVYRNFIPLTDDVAQFDADIAFSGATWGGVGVGLYALIKEHEFIVDFLARWL